MSRLVWRRCCGCDWLWIVRVIDFRAGPWRCRAVAEGSGALLVAFGPAPSRAAAPEIAAPWTRIDWSSYRRRRTWCRPTRLPTAKCARACGQTLLHPSRARPLAPRRSLCACSQAAPPCGHFGATLTDGVSRLQPLPLVFRPPLVQEPTLCAGVI